MLLSYSPTLTSLVGVRMRALEAAGVRGMWMMRSSMGRMKAAVFPDPVTAEAQISLPARAGGMHWAWIEVGVT